VALARGEVVEARAFLERAAEAGDARALLVLGDTYDPSTLARLGAIGIKGDVARAHDYYARAREAGLDAARPRLAAAETTQ
jgi:TPR repeat protein